MSNLTQELIQKVNDLTTIVNSIIAKAKKTSDLPDATLPLNASDLIRVTQGGISRKTAQSEFAGSGDALGRMRWMNKWVNATYVVNDVVVDGSYTMVANKTTTDRAAPQLIGDANWVYDGTIGTEVNSAKIIISGVDYTLPEALSISKYRVDIITGNEYAIYLVIEPDTTNIIEKIIDFVAIETGWVEVAIRSQIISAGVNFRILLVTNEPDTTPVLWSGDWDYNTPQNARPPVNGEIVHANSSSNTIDISKIDDLAGDRGAELLALTAGDIIEGAGVRWSISTVVDYGTYVSFNVAPGLQGGPDGVTTFNFETVSATSITIGKDTDHWVGNAQVRGLYILDGGINDVVENDHAYGIDVEIQRVVVSADWDYLAISGGAGGSSSSGGGDIEIVDNLTTQDPTKALSANQGYVLDQTKANIDHVHTGTLGDIIEKIADYSTLNNDAESDATLVMKAPATSILLDSTSGVSVGFRQEVVNNIGGVLIINVIGTDAVIGVLPANIPDGQMAYYVLVAANLWAIAYGEEVAPHLLTDHVDINSVSPSPNDRLAWDNVSSMWIPKASLSALGFVEFAYTLKLPADSTPASGNVSRDTDNPSTATKLYFNKLDGAGNDKTLFFQEMKSGDWINLHDNSDATNEESYDIIGASVLVGDIWEIPVLLYQVGGAVLQNNDSLQVFWRILQEEVLQVAIVLHDDGNGDGYVPANRDFTNFAAVGFNALDTSWADGTYGIDRGASGENAVTFGMNVKASAWGSTAIGFNLNALGVLAFVHGYQNQASGYAPVMFGFDNLSTADYSFTGGVSNQDDGDRNFMWGQALKATLSTGATIVGQANVDPASNNIAFLVGIGTVTQEGDNSLTRLVPKDGFTVFKDGTVRVATPPNVDDDIGNRGYNDSRYSQLTVSNIFTNTNFIRGNLYLGQDNNASGWLGFYSDGQTGGTRATISYIGSSQDLRFTNSGSGVFAFDNKLEVTGTIEIIGGELQGDGTALLIGVDGFTAVNHGTYESIWHNNIRPVSSGSENMGSTTYRWGEGWFESLDVSGNILVSTDPTIPSHVGNRGYNDARYTVRSLSEAGGIVVTDEGLGDWKIDGGKLAYKHRLSSNHTIDFSVSPSANDNALYEVVNDSVIINVTLGQDPSFDNQRIKTKSFLQKGTQQIHFVAGNGVTIISKNSLVDSEAQYAMVTAIWLSATEVLLRGELS